MPWEEFCTEFNMVHTVKLGHEMHALKSTIDLTHNDHVSNFEFDVFTRCLFIFFFINNIKL